MRADCVTARETTSSAGTSGLVGTDEAVAVFEVSVPVALDLPEVCVPVETVSYSAETVLFSVAAGDHPRIVAFVRGAYVFLVPFRNTGRWKKGTRDGRLILADGGLSDGVEFG